MDKNNYMILNDLIYQLYTEKSFDQLKRNLLKRLKLLIPCSYASLLMAQEEKDRIILSDPVCLPAEFQRSEKEYLATVNNGQPDWILYSSESVLIRESDFAEEDRRFNTAAFQKCYRDCHIFDSLKMSIVNAGKIYAVLNLYRVKSEGLFTNDEVMYLQSLSKHLNYLFCSHLQADSPSIDSLRLKEISARFQLTRRESEILSYIAEYLDNEEILGRIPISEHTLQKHLQNIYRKCAVSSKLELLRLCVGSD